MDFAWLAFHGFQLVTDHWRHIKPTSATLLLWKLQFSYRVKQASFMIDSDLCLTVTLQVSINFFIKRVNYSTFSAPFNVFISGHF